MDVKYPHITVELIGKDGNAFYILGAVKKVLVQNNVPREEINKYINEASLGTYDNLLRVTLNYVNVI